MKKEWITIDAPGPVCEINRSGTIRQKEKLRGGKIIKNWLRIPTPKTGSGKLYVPFYDNETDERQNHYVHLLVLRYFVPNPEGKRQGRHLDGDLTRNHASNLEWV